MNAVCRIEGCDNLTEHDFYYTKKPDDICLRCWEEVSEIEKRKKNEQQRNRRGSQSRFQVAFG